MKTPSNTHALHTAALTGFLFLALLSPATAADFAGSLKGVTITDAQTTNKAPIASFNYSISGSTVNLDASGSSDPDGSITSYQWDFGDGNQGTGISVSHNYADITSANVSLTVLDNSKGIAISQKKITIGSCQSQSADVSYVTSYKITPDIYGNIVQGQSFTPNTTGKIYSIKVTSYYIPNPSLATLMIRVGDTADLSTTYDTEEIVSLASYTSKDTIEVVFTKKPTITSGVTKYFMIYNTGDFATRFMLYRNSNSGYANGTDYTSKTGLASVTAGSGDLSFEVMTCD
jgi:PKD repeat protein